MGDSAQKTLGSVGTPWGLRGDPWDSVGLRRGLRDGGLRRPCCILLFFAAIHACDKGLRLLNVNICGIPFLAEQPPFKIKKGEARSVDVRFPEQAMLSLSRILRRRGFLELHCAALA